METVSAFADKIESRIDVLHVLVTAPDNLHKPIVLIYVGQQEGILGPYEDSPDDNSWVVGSGNHRTLAAGLHERGLRGYVLTEEQSRQYEMNEDDCSAE